MGIDLTITADLSYKPNLHTIHKILDEHIVGEFESRMALFTNWILAERNVNLAGQRASGKTWLVDNVCIVIPQSNGLYNLSAGSEKSAWYQAEQIKRHNYIKVPELNKLPKENLELLKDWGEGKTAEYRTTIIEGGYRRIQSMKITPKPFVFCLADEEEMKIDDQLRSRLTVIRTDQTEEQNNAVLTRQAELAMLPDNPYEVALDNIEDIRQHIATMPPLYTNDKNQNRLLHTEFRHPASLLFKDCIPKYFTDCRRDFPKYLANTFGITRYHWKERIFVEKNNKRIFFVTPEDMYYNHIIYTNILVESSLRCSNMERQFIMILQNTKQPLNRNQIQIEIRKIGMNVSSHMISRHLHALSDLGYVETIKIGNQHATYKEGPLFKDFSFVVNWQDIIETCIKNMKDYYPTIAEDYISKFCGTTIPVIEPFTGEELDLRKFKTQEIKKKVKNIIVDDYSEPEEDKKELIVEEIVDDIPEQQEL